MRGVFSLLPFFHGRANNQKLKTARRNRIHMHARALQKGKKGIRVRDFRTANNSTAAAFDFRQVGFPVRQGMLEFVRGEPIDFRA